MSVGVTSPCRPRVVPARKATTTQVTTTPTQQDTRCEYGISAPYPATNTRSFDIKLASRGVTSIPLSPLRFLPSLPSLPTFVSYFLPSLSIASHFPSSHSLPSHFPFSHSLPHVPLGRLLAGVCGGGGEEGRGEGGHSRSFLQVIFYSWFLFYRLLTAL